MASKAHGQTGPKGITEDDIAAAMEKNFGNELLTAMQLKCSPQNIRLRIAGSKRLLELRQHLKYDLRDAAKNVVAEAIIRKKDLRAAIFVLDRLGKDDGWGRTIAHTGADGGAIEHAVTAQQVDPVTPEEIAAARRRFIDDSDD
jgi:hypothetical protein